MPGAHRHHEMLVQQQAAGVVRSEGREDRHGQIALAATQTFLSRFAALPGLNHQVDARCQLGQSLVQLLRDDDRREVGHDDAHGLAQGAQVGTGSADQRADRAQNLLQRTAQGLRLGGQLHAARYAFEQAILEQMPTTLQRIGGRRLRQADTLGRAGDVGFVEQRIEHGQQIEVHRT
ncbi:hypothetical protein D3C84_456880 [compost metagenome]